MDSRLRRLRPTFWVTSTNSGIACPPGATFLRRCGGSIFRKQGAERGRWVFRRSPTPFPRGSSVVTWSRYWSRCFILTPTATAPANLQSMRCAKPVSAADWVLDLDVKGYFDSIDWELLLSAVRRHTDCPWVLLYIERWLKVPVQ